jgi:flagellar motor switch protein FliN/FliY
VSADASLLGLGESTAEAVEQLLHTLCADSRRAGAVSVSRDADEAVTRATSGLTFPAVAADVSYVDGVTGGNVFLLGLEGARKLAASMMGDGAAPSSGNELSELELSAVGEAMNQMMSAAAAATGSALGQEIQIAPPQIRVVATAEEASEVLRTHGAQHVLVTGFVVAECHARLVQMVPNAYVVRMERALDSQTTEYTSAPMGDALRAVPVRVWAELGRARMPAGSSLALPTGSVVELDREVDDPVDLYVDGMRCATGRLMVAEDGSLQLAIDEVFGLKNGPLPADQQETVTDSPTVQTEV